jgi:hypothetical protein
MDSAVYFSRMGVDGGKLAVIATAARKGDPHLFSAAELADVGLSDAKSVLAEHHFRAERASDPAKLGWWWLVGLVGFGAVFWVLTQRGAEASAERIARNP